MGKGMMMMRVRTKYEDRLLFFTFLTLLQTPSTPIRRGITYIFTKPLLKFWGLTKEIRMLIVPNHPGTYLDVEYNIFKLCRSPCAIVWKNQSTSEAVDRYWPTYAESLAYHEYRKLKRKNPLLYHVIHIDATGRWVKIRIHTIQIFTSSSQIHNFKGQLLCRSSRMSSVPTSVLEPMSFLKPPSCCRRLHNLSH